MTDDNKITQTDKALELLKEGFSSVLNSDEYKNFLDTMSKFYHYSANNCYLIFSQMKEATHVASYTDWQNKFKRQVAKGAKALYVLAPNPYKKQIEVTDENNQPVFKADGTPETKEIQVMRFRAVPVFDISQTEGPDLPSFGVDELTGEVEAYDMILQTLEKISRCPIAIEPINTSAKGYYSPSEDRIVVADGMSQLQVIKTLCHEITHSYLHSKKESELANILGQDDIKKSLSQMELEAESAAYVLTKGIGNLLGLEIDTGEYSFPYLVGWAEGKDIKEQKELLETVRKTSLFLIDKFEDAYKEILTEKMALKQQPQVLELAPSQVLKNTDRPIAIKMKM